MRRCHARRSASRNTLLALGLALTLTASASAWQVSAATAPPTATPAPAATPAPVTAAPAAGPVCPPQDLKKVRVSSVRVVPPLNREGEPKPADQVAQLRDTIAVKVEGLQTLLAQEVCADAVGPERSIILYLNDRPLPKVVASPPTDPETQELMFPLNRTEDSRDVWTYLLGRPRLQDRKVQVSVGLDNLYAVPSTATIELRVIPRLWFFFWLLIFAGLLIGFWILADRSNILRDPVASPQDSRPPYSLARTQAAWWFFLVLGSYLLIGMVTGDFSTSITGTVLVLLGISAGTAAGSAFIDASKTSAVRQVQDAAQATNLMAQMKTIEGEATDAAGEVTATGDPAQAQKMATMMAVYKDKVSAYNKVTNRSEGFLLDLLSDSTGVNFHRFQIAAWTIVLGFIFIGHVYRDLAMPQFNETLLALMGISSGTYLGLKIPENPSPNPAPESDPPPPPPVAG